MMFSTSYLCLKKESLVPSRLPEYKEYNGSKFVEITQVRAML